MIHHVIPWPQLVVDDVATILGTQVTRLDVLHDQRCLAVSLGLQWSNLVGYPMDQMVKDGQLSNPLEHRQISKFIKINQISEAP